VSFDTTTQKTSDTLSTFRRQYFAKVCLHSSADVWKCWDPVWGHEGRARNSNTPTTWNCKCLLVFYFTRI